MKTFLTRAALTVGVLLNGLLLAGQLLFLYVLLLTASPDVIIVGDGTPGSHLSAAVLYFLPLAVGLGLWRVHRYGGWLFLVRALYLTMAAFYVVALVCVIVCRVHSVTLEFD